MKILPMEFCVVILPDKVDEVTKGGIIRPKQNVDVEQHGSTTGVIIAISPLAFSYADWPAGSRQPQVGDRVLTARYPGTLVDNDKPDGYRVVKDKDILAVIED